MLSPSEPCGKGRITAPFELQKKLADALRRNDIYDEVTNMILTEPTNLKGDQNGSKPVYVEVHFTDMSKEPMYLFMKEFMNNEESIEWLKTIRVMEKESFFFNKFLPCARKFCKPFPECKDMLTFFPKFYYGDEEMLVFENVVLDNDFEMLSSTDLRDLFTSKIVLGNLAKFHAVGYAMIQDMGLDAFKTKFEPVTFESLFKESVHYLPGVIDNGLKTCIKILKGNPVDGSEYTSKILATYIGEAFRMGIDVVEFDEKTEPIICLNHGDCWNNNLMFKIDLDTGLAIDQMFVDWQVTRLGSPNLDVGTFLYTTVKPSVRRAHLKELLQHYYQIFESTVESLNLKCPTNFEAFFEDYKRRRTVGFFLNLSFNTVQAALRDFDPEQISLNMENTVDAYNKAINNWMSHNQDKAEQMAKEIVATLREFLNL